jgi:hypothetical protein
MGRKRKGREREGKGKGREGREGEERRGREGERGKVTHCVKVKFLLDIVLLAFLHFILDAVILGTLLLFSLLPFIFVLLPTIPSILIKIRIS